MIESEKYYRENLYPFQDGVLNIVGRSELPFFLTGGTALSRYYFHHRFSDDLDLFLNADQEFNRHVDVLISEITREAGNGAWKIEATMSRRSDDFAQIFLSRGSVILKIDMVNDIAVRFGKLAFDDALGRIDSWRNILSNKISAIYRFAPKDIVDIWIISKNRSFAWVEIIREAKEKEMGVDPIAVSEIVRSMPVSAIEQIRWFPEMDTRTFFTDLAIIAGDILTGESNSLCR